MTRPQDAGAGQLALPLDTTVTPAAKRRQLLTAKRKLLLQLRAINQELDAMDMQAYAMQPDSEAHDAS